MPNLDSGQQKLVHGMLIKIDHLKEEDIYRIKQAVERIEKKVKFLEEDLSKLLKGTEVQNG